MDIHASAHRRAVTTTTRASRTGSLGMTGIALAVSVLAFSGCTGTGPANPPGPEEATPTGAVSSPALPTAAASPVDDQEVAMQWARLVDNAMNSAQDELGVKEWSVDHQLLTGRTLNGSCAVTLWSFGHSANGRASWQDWLTANRSLLVTQGFPEPLDGTTANGQPVLESLLPEGNLRYWSTHDGRNVKIVLDIGTTDNRC